MGRTLVEHTYEDTTADNPDGSVPIRFEDATSVEGPGETPLGSLDRALDLSASAGGVADLSGLDLVAEPYGVRTVVDVTTGPDEAQALVASDALGFELQVEAGEDNGSARLAATVDGGSTDSRVATRFTAPLDIDSWHLVDLVVDTDAIVLAVDEEVVAVHAIVDGSPQPGDGHTLAVGTSLQDAADFTGSIAALQVVEGIPDDLAGIVDDAHADPDWFITRKVASIHDRVELGRPTEPAHEDDAIGAWVQRHQHGTVLYEEAAGVAFELHGGIHDHWRSLGTKARAALGPLLGDEEDTRVGGGRRSLFRGGSINWVRGAGAVVLTGAIFRDWELGEAPKEIGLPVADREAVDGGHVQRFRHGRMYHREGRPHAHWVKGAILDRFVDTGGLDQWGFPVSDERDVVESGRTRRVDRDRTRRRDHRDGSRGGDDEPSGPAVRDHREGAPGRDDDESAGAAIRDHRDGALSARRRDRSRTRAQQRRHHTTTAVRGGGGDDSDRQVARSRRRRDTDRSDIVDEPGLPDLPDRPDVPTDPDNPGGDRPDHEGDDRPGDGLGGTPTRRVAGRVSQFEDATIWWSRDTGARVLHGPIAQRYDDSGGPTGPLGFPTSSVQDIDPRFDPSRASLGHPDPTPGPRPDKPGRPDGPGDGDVVIKATGAGTDLAVARSRRHAEPETRRPGTAEPRLPHRPGQPDLPDVPDRPDRPDRPDSDEGDGSTGDDGTGGAERTSPGRVASFRHGSIVDLDAMSDDPLLVPRFTMFLDTIATDESERFGMGENDLHAWITVEVDGDQVHHERHPGPDDTWSDENVVDLSLTIPVDVTPDAPDREVELAIDVRDSDPGSDDHLGVVSWHLHPGNAWGLAEDDGFLRRGPTGKVDHVIVAVQPQVDASALTHEEKFWVTGNPGSEAIDWDEFAVAFPQADTEPEWYDPGDWFVRAFHELFVEDLAQSGNCVGMSVEAIHARKGSSAFALPLDRFDDWSVLEETFNIRHAYQLGHAPIDWFLGQFVLGNTDDPREVFRLTRKAFRAGNDPILCVAENHDFGGSKHCVLPVEWDPDSRPWTITILDPNHPNDTRTLEIDADNRFTYEGGKYEGGPGSGSRIHWMPFDVLDRPQRVPSASLLQLLGGSSLGIMILVSKTVKSLSLRAPDGTDLDATGQPAAHRLRQGSAPEGTFLRYRGFEDRSRSKAPSRDPVAGQLWFQVGAADEQGADRPSPRGFHHELVGIGDGDLDYVVDHGHGQVRLQGDLAADEPADVEVVALGSPRQQVRVHADRDKAVSVEVTSQLGTAGDRMRVSVADVPVSGDRPLALNAAPGLAGVDLVGASQRADVPVEVEATVDGATTRRRFTVDVDHGTRLRPVNTLSGAELATASIDELFAPASQHRRVTAD